MSIESCLFLSRGISTSMVLDSYCLRISSTSSSIFCIYWFCRLSEYGLFATLITDFDFLSEDARLPTRRVYWFELLLCKLVAFYFFRFVFDLWPRSERLPIVFMFMPLSSPVAEIAPPPTFKTYFFLVYPPYRWLKTPGGFM